MSRWQLSLQRSSSSSGRHQWVLACWQRNEKFAEISRNVRQTFVLPSYSITQREYMGTRPENGQSHFETSTLKYKNCVGYYCIALTRQGLGMFLPRTDPEVRRLWSNPREAAEAGPLLGSWSRLPCPLEGMFLEAFEAPGRGLEKWSEVVTLGVPVMSRNTSTKLRNCHDSVGEQHCFSAIVFGGGCIFFVTFPPMSLCSAQGAVYRVYSWLNMSERLCRTISINNSEMFCQKVISDW